MTWWSRSGFALVRYIRAAGGTVLAEECKPYVLDPQQQVSVGEEIASSFPPPQQNEAGGSSSRSSDAAEEAKERDEHGAGSSETSSLLSPHPGSSSSSSAGALPSAVSSRQSRYMFPILAHLHGHSVVSLDGALVAYTFPTLVAQYHRLRAAGQLQDESVRVQHAYAREPMWLLSHCSVKQVYVAVALGAFNLFLVLVFPLMVTWTEQQDFIDQGNALAQTQEEQDFAYAHMRREQRRAAHASMRLTQLLYAAWWLLSSIQVVYPFLLTFALGFFLLPAARWVVLKYMLNLRVAQRNARRKAWALTLRGSRAPEQLKQAQRKARAMGIEGSFGDAAAAASAQRSEATADSSHASAAAGSSYAASSSAAPRSTYMVAQAAGAVAAAAAASGASAAAGSGAAPSSVITEKVYETVSQRVSDEMRTWQAVQQQRAAALAGEEEQPPRRPSAAAASAWRDGKKQY